MYEIIYYVSWGVGAVALWIVSYRIFVYERQNPNTDMTYGTTVMLAVISMVPIINLMMVYIMIVVYPKLFDTSGWWIRQLVYKEPVDQ